MHTVLVLIHAANGTAGLLLALPILLAPKRRGRHTLLGRIYAVAALGLGLSALGLFALDPARLCGVGDPRRVDPGLAARRALVRPPPSARDGRPGLAADLAPQPAVSCSTVIAFVTGFAVQMTDGNLVAWLAPTVLGSLLIARTTAREVARAPRRIMVNAVG